MARRVRLTRRNHITVADASTLGTLAAVGMAMVILYVGRAIAIPIAIAALISFSMGPLVTWLRRRQLGRVPAVAMAVLPALFFIGAFAYVVTAEMGRLAENLPSYQTNIERKFSSVQSMLPARDLIDRGAKFFHDLRVRDGPPLVHRPISVRPAGSPRDRTADALSGPTPIPVEIQSPDPTSLDIVKSVLGPLVEPVAEAGLVLMFVVFFLLERENLRDRFIRLAGGQDIHRTTLAMDEAGYRVSRYLLFQLLVNALFGVALATGLYVIGVPNAALWGGVAAVLRFIPYVGVMIASALPLALAFAVDPGWSMLVWTGGLFVGLELLVGNAVEPFLYGASTGLSAVAVVISAIFWTWLWGGIGLLLAMPLTVCMAVLGRYVPKLGFLEILLGNEAPLKPEETFYQRLLAGDPDEATQLAEDFLKSGTLLMFCDQVALPALAIAERDRERGVLDDEHSALVIQGAELVFENLESDARSLESSASAIQRRPVFCVAGRGELDEAAAFLLCRLLTDQGYDARTMSLVEALRPAAEKGEPPHSAVVCISYMNPDSIPHARYLGRRLRRWLDSNAAIIVGFWTNPNPTTTSAELRTETGADAVVTNFRAALASIEHASAVGNSDREEVIEAGLTALAARAGALVSGAPA